MTIFWKYEYVQNEFENFILDTRRTKSDFTNFDSDQDLFVEYVTGMNSSVLSYPVEPVRLTTSPCVVHQSFHHDSQLSAARFARVY